MKRAFLAAAVGLTLLAPVAARAQGEGAVKAAIRDQAVRAAKDPSSRSRLAAPLVDFSAEIGKDKKTATAKAGFDFGDDFVIEAGVTGAFDESADRSPLTSFRELTPGSKLWGAVNWRRYRVNAVFAKLERVCREAAWAAGLDFHTFECVESKLPATSFAERLPPPVTPSALATNVPLVCIEFARAIGTGEDVVHGRSRLDCRQGEAEILAAVRALGATVADPLANSYATRHAAATTDAAKLALCNEYRRSERLPPDEKCDAATFARQENWTKSWQARFDAATAKAVAQRLEADNDVQRAEVCAEFDRARGVTPSNRTDCGSDTSELFIKSFKARYQSGYRWALTPIVGLRYDTSRTTYSFVDATLAAQTPQTHQANVWTGTVGFLTPGDTLLALNYANALGRKAGTKRNICQPFANTNATTCRDVIIGAPTEDNREQYELEVKRRLGTKFAGGVYVTRDTALEAWGVELPIYFIKNDKGGLAGGIVASYRGETKLGEPKRWDVSVFIGQAFDLHDDN